MALESCYFCGVADADALQEHHVIPRRIDSDGKRDDERVVTCANCHSKVHNLVDPVVDYLSDDGDDRDGDDSAADSDQFELRRRREAQSEIRDITDGGETPVAIEDAVDDLASTFSVGREDAEDLLEAVETSGAAYRVDGFIKAT